MFYFQKITKNKFNKKEMTLKNFHFICLFTRFLVYIIMLKKLKTSSHKKVWKYSCLLIRFYCLNNFLFINKFLPKFYQPKILHRLEKNGIINIRKKISYSPKVFNPQIKNRIKIYSEKLESFYKFSKFVFWQ